MRNSRIILNPHNYLKNMAVSATCFVSGFFIFAGGKYAGDIVSNGFILKLTAVIISVVLWMLAVDKIFKAYNITILREDEIKLIRSPFAYIFGGDRTLGKNKNHRLAIDDILYITHTFGIDGAKIGDTYLILTNYPIDDNYVITNDKNAITLLLSEDLLSALKEYYEYSEINNLRSVVEEKSLYRITTTPQGDKYVKSRKFIRSVLLPVMGVWWLIMAVIMMFIGFGKDDGIWEKILDFSMIAGMLSFFLYSIGYYAVTKDEIIEYIIPFVPMRSIKFSDYAEIGVFTVKSKELGRSGYMEDRYKDYFYFSPRILSEDERMNIRFSDRRDIKRLPYNKKIHTYLADNLGIELKGKLIERRE